MEWEISPLRESWKTIYVSGNIWKSRWIWLVGYVENSNWCCHAFWLQGVSGRSLYIWSMTRISRTIPLGNEWPSWTYMGIIAKDCTFNYGAHIGFWRIYTFFINICDWSYINRFNNKTIGKSGRWTNYTTQTGKWH